MFHHMCQKIVNFELGRSERENDSFSGFKTYNFETKLEEDFLFSQWNTFTNMPIKPENLQFFSGQFFGSNDYFAADILPF